MQTFGLAPHLVWTAMVRAAWLQQRHRRGLQHQALAGADSLEPAQRARIHHARIDVRQQARLTHRRGRRSGHVVQGGGEAYAGQFGCSLRVHQLRLVACTAHTTKWVGGS